jgi:Ca2+-binding RTX toxin-like protein
MRRHVLKTMLIFLAALMVTPSLASAATVDVREMLGQQAVTYLAAPGEWNEFSMTARREGAEWIVVIYDQGTLDIGVGCVEVASGAQCTTSERPRIDVELGDGKDDFEGDELDDQSKPPAPIVVNGGDGADSLTSVAAYSCLNGQGDNDLLELFPPRKSIAGIETCSVNGGGGDDWLRGSSAPDVLDGDGGRDLIAGGPSGDHISGADGRDLIIGRGGPDEIEPGRGADRVDGEGGDDEISAAGGEADKVDCGPGEDVTSVDQFDDVKNCEIVNEVIVD